MKADRHDAPEWIRSNSRKRGNLGVVIPGLIGTVITVGALYVASQALLQGTVKNLAESKQQPKPVPVAEIRRAEPGTDWSKVVEEQARRDAMSQPQAELPTATENTATMSSGGSAVGATLAFNTMGWASQNVLFKAVDALVQSSYGGYFFPINDAILDKGLDTEELVAGIDIAYANTGDARLLSVAQSQMRVLLSPEGLQVAQALPARAPGLGLVGIGLEQFEVVGVQLQLRVALGKAQQAQVGFAEFGEVGVGPFAALQALPDLKNLTCLMNYPLGKVLFEALTAGVFWLGHILTTS